MPQENDSNLNFRSFVGGLRQALPYLDEFYTQTFVIELDDNTLSQHALPVLLKDIVLLHRMNINVVLVHGADPAITEGHSVSSAKRQQAIAETNWNLLHQLSDYGPHVLPLTGSFLVAERMYRHAETEQGEISTVRLGSLRSVLQQRHLVVIPPFAHNHQGQPLLLKPQHVATELAVRIHAQKLILYQQNDLFLESIPGRSKALSTEAMQVWMSEQNQLPARLKQQLQSLIHACERGVERCHLINPDVDGALLSEVLTSAGNGLMVTNSSYKQILSAELQHLPAILKILESPMQTTAITHRSAAYLEQNLDRFLIYCIDEEVVGVCELIGYSERSAVEIACFVVKPTYRNRGIGQALIQEVVRRGYKSGNELVFALSTSQAHVFTNSGFQEIDIQQLPQSKQDHYDTQHSIVYGKKLNSSGG